MYSPLDKLVHDHPLHNQFIASINQTKAELTPTKSYLGWLLVLKQPKKSSIRQLTPGKWAPRCEILTDHLYTVLKDVKPD